MADDKKACTVIQLAKNVGLYRLVCSHLKLFCSVNKTHVLCNFEYLSNDVFIVEKNVLFVI